MRYPNTSPAAAAIPVFQARSARVAVGRHAEIPVSLRDTVRQAPFGHEATHPHSEQVSKYVTTETLHLAPYWILRMGMCMHRHPFTRQQACEESL